MATLIQTWLDLALQQMAAESYLDQFLLGARSLTEVLINGNNNEDIIPVDRFDGYTRFVDLASLPNASEITGSVQEFAGRYQIVDHHANDATGFSATLMKDLSDPNDKISPLSFRSVEYEKQVDDGEWERGGMPGTAGAIAGTGYSLARRVSIGRHVVCATISVDFIKEGQSTEISASTRHTPPRGGNADRRSSSSRP